LLVVSLGILSGVDAGAVVYWRRDVAYDCEGEGEGGVSGEEVLGVVVCGGVGVGGGFGGGGGVDCVCGPRDFKALMLVKKKKIVGFA
jgi:hypothetical protein